MELSRANVERLHREIELETDSVKGTIQIRDVVFFYFINFLGAFHSKRSSYASQYIYFHVSYQ